MIVGVLADLHYGKNIDGSNVFDRSKETFDQFLRAIDFLKFKKVDVIIVAGDLSHSNCPSIETNTYISATLVLLDKLSIPVLVIPGNHDYTHDGKHVLLPFVVHTYENVTVMDNPGLWNNMCVIPHVSRKILGDVRSKKEYSEKVQDYYNRMLLEYPSDILITHVQLPGSIVHTDYMFESGTVVCDQISNLKMIITGDIHRGQIYSTPSQIKVIYPGSLTQTDYGERDEKKGVAIVDTDMYNATLYEIEGYAKYIHVDVSNIADIDTISLEQSVNTIFDFTIVNSVETDNIKQKIVERGFRVRNIHIQLDEQHVVKEIVSVSSSRIQQFQDYLQHSNITDNFVLQKGTDIITEVESDN